MAVNPYEAPSTTSRWFPSHVDDKPAKVTSSFLRLQSAGPRSLNPRQFNMRTLFLITTGFAIFYAILSWFGILAQFAVSVVFLVCGPLVGVAMGIKWSNETDPIVNAVQAGALGGAAGFICTFLLLAPAHIDKSSELLLFVAFLGVQVCFAVGGLLGFCAGAVRAIVNMFVSH